MGISHPFSSYSQNNTINTPRKLDKVGKASSSHPELPFFVRSNRNSTDVIRISATDFDLTHRERGSLAAVFVENLVHLEFYTTAFLTLPTCVFVSGLCIGC